MCKVIATLIYALTVSLTHSVSLLAVESILPMMFLLTGKISPKSLIKINIMNAVMILTLSLTWPVFSDGLKTGAIIAARVNMIYTVFFVTMKALGVSGLYGVLLSMRLPVKLCVLFVLTVRGIEILRERFDTALISARLRAPDVTSVTRLRIFASVLGTVLLQSVIHSENMTRAVKLRGGFRGFMNHAGSR